MCRYPGPGSADLHQWLPADVTNSCAVPPPGVPGRNGAKVPSMCSVVCSPRWFLFPASPALTRAPPNGTWFTSLFCWSAITRIIARARDWPWQIEVYCEWPRAVCAHCSGSQAEQDTLNSPGVTSGCAQLVYTHIAGDALSDVTMVTDTSQMDAEFKVILSYGAWGFCAWRPTWHALPRAHSISHASLPKTP